jgi:ArsR family transcriptional regulator, arsenate/arsenite/antimonite-responsive transcriptional repressor
MNDSEHIFDNFIEIAKAFSDPNRVRAFMVLRNGELCVCQIIELLGLAPSTVSKHMSILKKAGLVQSRKEERWMYYRLPKEGEGVLNQSTLKWIFEVLRHDSTVYKDGKSMDKIIKQNPSSLCRMQRGK